MSFNAVEIGTLRTKMSLGVGRSGQKILYVFNITDDTESHNRLFERSRDFCHLQTSTDGETPLSLVKIEGKEESDVIKGWGVLYSEGVGNTQHFAWIAKSAAVGQQWKWGDGTAFAEWNGAGIDGAFTDWRNDATGANENSLCIRHFGEPGWRAGQCNYGVALERTQYVICQQEVPPTFDLTSVPAPSAADTAEQSITTASPAAPTPGGGEAQDRGPNAVEDGSWYEGSWQLPLLIGLLLAVLVVGGIIIAVCVLRKNQAANKDTSEGGLMLRGNPTTADDEEKPPCRGGGGNSQRQLGDDAWFTSSYGEFPRNGNDLDQPLVNSDLNLIPDLIASSTESPVNSGRSIIIHVSK